VVQVRAGVLKLSWSTWVDDQYLRLARARSDRFGAAVLEGGRATRLVSGARRPVQPMIGHLLASELNQNMSSPDGVKLR